MLGALPLGGVVRSLDPDSLRQVSRQHQINFQRACRSSSSGSVVDGGIDPILTSFQWCYRSRHIHYWLREIPTASSTAARRASLRRFHSSSDITPSSHTCLRGDAITEAHRVPVSAACAMALTDLHFIAAPYDDRPGYTRFKHRDPAEINAALANIGASKRKLR
jgi:hypothetical protein